jgi:aryl-alcohol dehydrogenase-like predicted oxidoreductase
MQTRQVGPFEVNAIGLGCMSMSHAYGTPDIAEAEKTLHKALDLGYNFLDTAALYGFGKNEELLGRVLKDRRSEYILASKCGLFKDAETGKRLIDASPEVIRKTCEDALTRLQTDVIDLYYLHRWDPHVPIEDSIGEMSRLLDEGKIRALGMSEVSAETLRKAHAVHPLAALQTEYSLWSRNAEIAVLDACKELGITFVAFSPLARQFLTGKLTDPESQLEEGDIRRKMPRFHKENYARNMLLIEEYRDIAYKVDCTPAQLALAWLLAQGEHIIPIPGTRHSNWAEENFNALAVTLDEDVLNEINALINQDTVVGNRYPDGVQGVEIDTEDFEAT